MPLHMIRKFSLRHRRRSPDSAIDIPVRKASSCKGLMRCDTEIPQVKISDEILTRVLDRMPLMEQLRLRALNRKAKQYVESKIQKTVNLDVRKAELSTLCSDNSWQFHPDAQLAIKISNQKVHIVVDSKWTSRDVVAVVGAMSVFRKFVTHAEIDAPIAELLVVSLSALDLDRWYAFQCYMKAMDVFDEDMHLPCAFTSPADVYWPRLESLVVTTTAKQAPHLERILDYGVHSSGVLERRNLNLIQIVFIDVEKSTTKLNRHIYRFKCWAGSAGFDHRFEQKFLANKCSRTTVI